MKYKKYNGKDKYHFRLAISERNNTIFVFFEKMVKMNTKWNGLIGMFNVQKMHLAFLA